MIDMSSTQALLHMVRTANAAQNAAELETYLKGKYQKITLCSQIRKILFICQSQIIIFQFFFKLLIFYYAFLIATCS